MPPTSWPKSHARFPYTPASTATRGGRPTPRPVWWCFHAGVFVRVSVEGGRMDRVTAWGGGGRCEGDVLIRPEM